MQSYCFGVKCLYCDFQVWFTFFEWAGLMHGIDVNMRSGETCLHWLCPSIVEVINLSLHSLAYVWSNDKLVVCLWCTRESPEGISLLDLHMTEAMSMDEVQSLPCFGSTWVPRYQHLPLLFDALLFVYSTGRQSCAHVLTWLLAKPSWTWLDNLVNHHEADW